MRTLTTSLWSAGPSHPVLDITVGELLREAASSHPEKGALASIAPDRDPRVWTYAELLDDAERAAAWLLQRFTPGEHIAVWAPNVPEWLILQFGAALSGLVLVTANPALRGPELSDALHRSHAVGLFSVRSFRGTAMSEVVDAILPGLPDLRETVHFEGWLHDVRRTPKVAELPDVDPQSPTQIQFTSGTTGRPKPALLRHRAMVTNATLVRDRCGAEVGGTFATALPLFHTAGSGLAVLGSVHQRATLVLAEIFDPALLLRAIEDYEVRVLGGVPLMLHAMLAHPALSSVDLSSLRVVMSGGDAVPAPLVEGWARACGAGFSAVYGQTELSPIVAQTRPSDTPDDNLHTAGQPLEGVDIAIVDPATGAVQPNGIEGEICARGYQVMAGYFGMPDATAETIDADGWLHTGDLGTMDSRGYLTVTGRLKDLIIRGGENIYPREIEAELTNHSGVAAAMVLGVPDEAWGEQVAAVLQLDPAWPRPTSADLRDRLRERLSPQKTPTSWYVAADLPTNAMGKLQKFRLREQIAAGELEVL